MDRLLMRSWCVATNLVLYPLLAACVAAPPAQHGGDQIVNLYDAFGPESEDLIQDFGFSALVRYQGKTILFDAGTNADVLKANAEALGVDLAEVDFAVASHAHFDHINGFDYLLEVNPDVKIYFPADMFWGMNVEFDLTGAEEGVAASLAPEQRYFGGTKEQVMFRQSGRFWGADVEFVSDHTKIGPGMTLIATRSPFIGYFTSYPTIRGAGDRPDDSSQVKTTGLPELSLNLEGPRGDVLMVGCSHSQVETIVRTTNAHLGRAIGLVYGGYHMLPYTSAEIRGVADRMRDELGVIGVAPAHCSGHAAFSVFGDVFGEDYHLAGLGTTTAFP